jgi:hypothetical protein
MTALMHNPLNKDQPYKNSRPDYYAEEQSLHTNQPFFFVFEFRFCVRDFAGIIQSRQVEFTAIISRPPSIFSQRSSLSLIADASDNHQWFGIIL